MEEKSIFREYFGDSPYIKVLDFLIEGQDFDYSMTEVAKKSEVGWSVFTKIWAKLIQKDLIIQTRIIGNAKLYKLNKDNIFIKKLLKFESELNKLETEKITSKKVIA